ncbi:MAG: hypothetical protein HC822_12710, partial [Oscillochloris sp.]|nr:hypothetical protein [Oscillochloris sp.]
MVEPSLLRPQQADRYQWAKAANSPGWQSAVLLALPADDRPVERRNPFAMRLCFVFPNWIKRLDHDFVERTLRQETPAHLDLQVQWLNRQQLRRFEAGYKVWLARLAGAASADSIAARAARDQLINLLRIGNPYPLRDLKLSYQSMVARDQPAEITILGAQIGVSYQLCDEEGNPVLVADQAFVVTRAFDQANDVLSLRTPAITRDVTYTILAVRATDAYGQGLADPLETYLISDIALRAGINTGLPVRPLPAADQIGSGQAITINYGDPLRVVVGDTQEGISYLLVRAGETGNLSAAVEGNLGEIILATSAEHRFTEDTALRVYAYRTLEQSNNALLDAEIVVLVRPDRAIAIGVEPADPPLIDYGAAATFVLSDVQDSVAYQLYRRDLVAADYVTAETAGRLAVGDTGVYIAAPAPITDWDNPAGYSLVGSFEQVRSRLTLTAEGLLEDTRFIVLATKKVNRERLQLDQTMVVLVRPDPAPTVTEQESRVPKNTQGMVVVTGTQRGVYYQLQLDGTPINPPGYDYRDRAVETSRIDVDFVVEGPADPQAAQLLLLPTDPVAKKTTYTVQAAKILSGVPAMLTAKATFATSRGSSGDEGGDGGESGGESGGGEGGESDG